MTSPHKVYPTAITDEYIDSQIAKGRTYTLILLVKG